MNKADNKEMTDLNLKVDRLNLEAKETSKRNSAESLKLSKEAINTALLSGYTKGLADAYLNAGISCRLSSNFEAAVEYFEEALKLNRKLKDRKAESRTLNAAGNVYLALSNYEKAIEFYDESTFVLQSIGDLEFEAVVITNRGLAFQQYGNTKAALNNYLESLSIYKTLELPIHYALLNNIGIVYMEKGFYNESMRYFIEALKRTEKVNCEIDNSLVIANIGKTYSYMKDYTNAITYLSEAAIYMKKAGNIQAESQVYSNLGKAFMNMRSFPESIRYYNKTLKYYKEISDTSSVAHTLCEMGELYFVLNDYKSCKYLFEECLKICKKINDPVNEVKAYIGLSKLYLKFQQHDKVYKYLNAAETIAESRNSLKELSYIYRLYSENYSNSGKYNNANEALDKYYSIKKQMISYEEENKLQAMLMGHISDPTLNKTIFKKNKSKKQVTALEPEYENID